MKQGHRKKGNEKMDMKSFTLALMAVLALSLCKPRMVVAQVIQGSQNYGTFGNRTVGQQPVPTPSTMFGAQTAPGGKFISPGQSNGSAAQPAPNVTVSPRSPAAEHNAAKLPAMPNSAPLSLPETNGPEGAIRTEPALGLAPGAAPPAASPQQPYSRSPELSDRLTQIARRKGLLFGPGIDVYVSNNVALIQGAVGTPSDSTLLAGLLALEPEVLRIDNRLVALGPNQTGTQHEARPNPGKTADAATKFSGGPITIINPATNTATPSYTLDGQAFTIAPGYGQNFHEDRAWVIRFSRGANRDEVQYPLHSGLYTFTSTDHGWELYHSKLLQIK
jgi:hypothetical protein